MQKVQMQAVLGYQIRVPIDGLISLWTTERRAQYLLIPRINAPLSVDNQVWPIADCPMVAKRIFDDFVTGPNEAPNGLDVFQLKQNVTPDTLSNTSGCHVVGIATQHDVAVRLRAKNFIVDPISLNTSLQIEMWSIGFDICDERLTSGLMNCGVTPDNLKKLRDAYGMLINRYGLFNQIDEAMRFASEINVLVSEHAPFIPVELFIVGPLLEIFEKAEMELGLLPTTGQ
jgi:hypothetical protein